MNNKPADSIDSAGLSLLFFRRNFQIAFLFTEIYYIIEFNELFLRRFFMKDSKKIRAGKADILILCEIVIFGLMTVLSYFLNPEGMKIAGIAIYAITSVAFIIFQIRIKYNQRAVLRKIISLLSFIIGNAVWIVALLPEELPITLLIVAVLLFLPMFIIADNKDKEDKKENE